MDFSNIGKFLLDNKKNKALKEFKNCAAQCIQQTLQKNQNQVEQLLLYTGQLVAEIRDFSRVLAAYEQGNSSLFFSLAEVASKHDLHLLAVVLLYLEAQKPAPDKKTITEISKVIKKRFPKKENNYSGYIQCEGSFALWWGKQVCDFVEGDVLSLLTRCGSRQDIVQADLAVHCAQQGDIKKALAICSLIDNSCSWGYRAISQIAQQLIAQNDLDSARMVMLYGQDKIQGDYTDDFLVNLCRVGEIESALGKIETLIDKGKFFFEVAKYLSKEQLLVVWKYALRVVAEEQDEYDQCHLICDIAPIATFIKKQKEIQELWDNLPAEVSIIYLANFFFNTQQVEKAQKICPELVLERLISKARNEKMLSSKQLNKFVGMIDNIKNYCRQVDLLCELAFLQTPSPKLQALTKKIAKSYRAKHKEVFCKLLVCLACCKEITKALQLMDKFPLEESQVQELLDCIHKIHGEKEKLLVLDKIWEILALFDLEKLPYILYNFPLQHFQNSNKLQTIEKYLQLVKKCPEVHWTHILNVLLPIVNFPQGKDILSLLAAKIEPEDEHAFFSFIQLCHQWGFPKKTKQNLVDFTNRKLQIETNRTQSFFEKNSQNLEKICLLLVEKQKLEQALEISQYIKHNETYIAKIIEQYLLQGKQAQAQKMAKNNPSDQAYTYMAITLCKVDSGGQKAKKLLRKVKNNWDKAKICFHIAYSQQKNSESSSDIDKTINSCIRYEGKTFLQLLKKYPDFTTTPKQFQAAIAKIKRDARWNEEIAQAAIESSSAVATNLSLRSQPQLFLDIFKLFDMIPSRDNDYPLQTYEHILKELRKLDDSKQKLKMFQIAEKQAHTFYEGSVRDEAISFWVYYSTTGPFNKKTVDIIRKCQYSKTLGLSHLAQLWYHDHPQKSRKLFAEAEKAATRDKHGHSWLILANDYIRIGDYKKAFAICKRMKPNCFDFTEVMEYLVANNLDEKAFEEAFAILYKQSKTLFDLESYTRFFVMANKQVFIEKFLGAKPIAVDVKKKIVYQWQQAIVQYRPAPVSELYKTINYFPFDDKLAHHSIIKLLEAYIKEGRWNDLKHFCDNFEKI